MNPVALTRRLIAAGITKQEIHRLAGLSRRALDQTINGATDKLTLDELERLQSLFRGVLPPSVVAQVHHPRTPPRFGR
jgi:transcriptional regulator with XRE-family HTH domain